jgi:hypothetical protein
MRAASWVARLDVVGLVKAALVVGTMMAVPVAVATS